MRVRACVSRVRAAKRAQVCVQRTVRAASRAEDLLSLQTPEDKRRRTVSDVLGEVNSPLTGLGLRSPALVQGTTRREARRGAADKEQMQSDGGWRGSRQRVTAPGLPLMVRVIIMTVQDS